MVLQNFSPIRCFLHNKWAQNMAAEEKKKKKIKKKVGKPIGDPVGTGCPNDGTAMSEIHVPETSPCTLPLE